MNLIVHDVCIALLRVCASKCVWPEACEMIASSCELRNAGKRKRPTSVSRYPYQLATHADLASRFNETPKSTWPKERIMRYKCESVIIPILKKDDRSSCESHKVTGFVRIAAKLFADIFIRQLSRAPQIYMLENQGGFWPAWVCIDHNFLRKFVEQRCTLRRPMVSISSDLKALFDSDDPCTEIVLQKSIFSFSSLHENSWNWV